MPVDPTTAAKAISATVSGAHAAADAATKPGGPVSRLLGLDVLRHDLELLQKELNKFSGLVEHHHGKHEQAAQAIGMLISKYDGLKDRVMDRLEGMEKLLDEKSKSQERALRDFEARLDLLSKLLNERLDKR